MILCPGSGGWSQPTPKVALDEGLPARQLYDLVQDPGETTNVADKQPEIVQQLTALLEEQIRTGRSTPGRPQANDRDVSLTSAVRVGG